MAGDDKFLDSGLRGFIYNEARKNYWRVASWYDLEDLIQDGFMCYAKCYARYGSTVTDQKHFMALVQTTFSNHIMTLYNKHRHQTEHAISALLGEDGSEEAFLDRHSTPEEGPENLGVLLRQAPAEIKQLIALLVGDGAKAVSFAKKRAGRFTVRETSNELYCRLLGLDPETNDIAGKVRSFFSS